MQHEERRAPAPAGPMGWMRMLGPGVAIAATGVGAGDLVAAAVAGSRFGLALLWSVLVGALLKLALNEGLARWQLATGTTLLEGWVERLGRPAALLFGAYLVAWSLFVGAALISACGLAGHAVFPQLGVTAWGALHSVVMALLVLAGGYVLFEGLMKALVGVMVVALVGCAFWVRTPWEVVTASLAEAGLPAEGLGLTLGILGGVGGSLTLLSYGYWIREKGWEGAAWLKMVRFDLSFAYGVTGLFGVAIMVLAAAVLHTEGIAVEGAAGVANMAEILARVLGPAGRWIFLAGFWAAVATSMLGVWQGVPYLFCDLLALLRGKEGAEREAALSIRTAPYRLYLAWLALPPLLLVAQGRPVALVVLYAIVGALFMPFLAGSLLVMNSRRAWVGSLRSGWLTQLALVAALALFAWLGATRILGAF